MSQSIPPEVLAAQFEALIREMPDKQKLGHDLAENHEWVGRAMAIVELADPAARIVLQGYADKLFSRMGAPGEARQQIMVMLQRFRISAQLKARGPLTMAFDSGQTFDYFDEIRKILESATTEVFVVDPYMGAEFIGRYLPHVKPNVQIRLLVQNKVAQVSSAAAAFAEQHGTTPLIKKSANLHDRYIFIDKRECYHSGATFKDGAFKSPTTLTQIVDAFTPVIAIYEAAWATATAPASP